MPGPRYMDNPEVMNALKLPAQGDSLRIAYNAALEAFKSAPMGTPILPSTLRSETVLGTQNAITWEIQDNLPNPIAGAASTMRTSERRLKTNDCFIATHISVQFGNELTAGVAPGSVMLQTWENPAAVAVLPATVGGFGTNAAPLIEAYNGTLDMTVDATVYLKNLDMLHFKRVDTAQAGTLLFTASNQAQSYYDGEEAWFPLAPFVNFNGKSGAKFQLNLPDSTNFSTVAANRVVAVLMLRGILVQNGAANL